MMTSHPIVKAYVDAVNTADLDAMVKLFTTDGEIVHPLGTFTGPGEIAGFYRDVVFAGQAAVTAGDVLTADRLVMAEISATSPLDPNAGTAYAIDVFRLDPGGRITSLEIYYR